MQALAVDVVEKMFGVLLRTAFSIRWPVEHNVVRYLRKWPPGLMIMSLNPFLPFFCLFCFTWIVWPANLLDFRRPKLDALVWRII